ncbi:uncharacterized protein LOC134271352 [Saccostrea cucullata]|uniref:uncharacterized protein LOC134271352 n=1 Tax=Saccostrea cuccullata TaxID=36930 RepID=UPI002ED5CABB
MNLCQKVRQTTRVCAFDLLLLCISLKCVEDITALPVVDDKLQMENIPSNATTGVNISMSMETTTEELDENTTPLLNYQSPSNTSPKITSSEDTSERSFAENPTTPSKPTTTVLTPESSTDSEYDESQSTKISETSEKSFSSLNTHQISDNTPSSSTTESFITEENMDNHESTVTSYPSATTSTTKVQSSSELPTLSGTSNFGYTNLITENETISPSYLSTSTTSYPVTTTDLQLMVTANISWCPLVIATPEFISEFFGQSVSYTGTVESYSEPAIFAIWLKIGHDKTEVININKDKYAGSKHLPHPLLRINNITFEDEVRYQLQVRISGGWCHGNTIRLEVKGILRFNDSCNMTKECDQRYHLECSTKYRSCMCASYTYHRNEICFNRGNLRAVYRGSEITTSRITVWWDDPSSDSNLIQYYTVSLRDYWGSYNRHISVGRKNNHTFESYFTPGYLFYFYITSTVLLNDPTEIINVTTSWIPLVVDPLPPGPLDVNASDFHPERLYLKWAVPKNNTYVDRYRVDINGAGYHGYNYPYSNIYTWPERLEPGENYSVTIRARSWYNNYFEKESTGYIEQIETLRTPKVIRSQSSFNIPFLSTVEIGASVSINRTDLPATNETKWQRIRNGYTMDINITDTRYNGSSLDLFKPKLVINMVDFYNEHDSRYRCLAHNSEGWGTSELIYVYLYGSLKFQENCSESRECEPNKHLRCRYLHQTLSCLCSGSYYHKDSVCHRRRYVEPYILGVEGSKCQATVKWRHQSVDVTLISGFQVTLYSLQGTRSSYWQHEYTIYVGNVTEYSTLCTLQPGRLYYFSIASKVLLNSPTETVYAYRSSSRWDSSGENTLVNHYNVTINGHQQQTLGNLPEIYWDKKLNPGSTYNVTIFAVSYGAISSGPWNGRRKSEPFMDWIEIDQTYGHSYMSYGERDVVLKGDDESSPHLKSPTKIFAGDGSHGGFNYVVVGTNGVIGLGEDFNSVAIKDINSAEMKDRHIICPFWTDLLTHETKGSVYYNTYERGKDAENDLFIGKASELIRLQFNDFPEFEAIWLLKVTWVNMTLFGDNSQSVTFQCILITNGEDTFTVIYYIDVNLNPIKEKKITLGYQYKSFFVKNPFSNKDAAFQMSENPGNRGIQGLWIYKMTTGIPKNKDEKDCYDWYTNNRERNTNVMLSPMLNRIECACDSRLLRFDPRYAINRFDRKNRVLCYASMTLGRNAECCYRMHGSINSLSTLERFRPVAGTLLKYNPFFERQLYSKSDLKPKEACCSSGHCDWYYEVRPIPFCYWRSPFQPGVNFGDPHILTLDGKNYTFNGYGEYTMMKINKDSVRFKFQARTDLATTANGTTTNATIFSAFVAEDQTGSKVQIDMTRDKQKMIIRVNGRDLTRDFENVNYTFLTRNLSVRWENQTISASFLDSSIILKVSLGVRFLISETVVDNTYMGFTRGLMGNFDGDLNNDFILPNETILDENATKTERDIYYKFGQLWLVDEESIFHYDKGLTNKNFSHPEFEPLFLDEISEEALENAKKKCGVNPSQACIFDYLATGDIALAESSGTEETISISEIKLIDNETPRISGNTSIQVEVGKVAELWFNTTDDSNQTPKYNILKSPEDFYLNTTTGVARWTPKSTNISEISLSVVDELGAESPSLDVLIIICGGCRNEGHCNYLNVISTENDRFKLALCDCQTGYSGEKCEIDTNGCFGGPCPLGRECTDLTPEEEKRLGRAYNCSECPPGFEEVGNKCEDINECRNGNVSVCDLTSETCENTEGSFLCHCISGLRKENEICTDIDECLEITSGCEQKCKNTIGSFICQCFPGFSLNRDNTSCNKTDENPCKDLSISCDYTCNTTSGSCICPIGYQLHENNHSCIDVNECEATPFPCEQNCSNINGSFQCFCRSGYTLNEDKVSCTVCKEPYYGENCSQICTCGPGMDKCNPVSGCDCLEGWAGETCSDDIDECKSNQSICESDKICQNLEGSYICNCREGFQRVGENCQDIDECSDLSLNDCPENTVCKNLYGNYTCLCKEGFQKRGSICEDVNECTQNIDDCSQICSNTEGGYNCECEFGFTLQNDRRNCEKVSDICTLFPELNCSYGCILKQESSTNKGYCFCESGFELDVDNSTCKDIDECKVTGTCEHNCTNTEGSFECGCAIGYTLQNDGKSCEVCIDGFYGDKCLKECRCGQGSERCDHINGCICKMGWTGQSCNQDINECNNTVSPCTGSNETCVNSDGSYTCVCKDGFQNSTNGCKECENGYYGRGCDLQCLCDTNNTDSCDSMNGFCNCKEGWEGTYCSDDINECMNSSICGTISYCLNLNGSYSCHCEDGFFLDGGLCVGCPLKTYGQNCSSICTCDFNNTQSCEKQNGTCNCKTGWQGKNCTEDIPECTNNPYICGNNSSCNEIQGSYSCICDIGFKMSSTQNCTKCSDITFGDQCSETCSCNVVGSIDCDDITGLCTCKDGWNGSNCEFTNECDSGANNCHKNASCQDTKDSYNCSCNVGFYGGGINCTECSDTTFGDQCSETCSCNVVGSIDCDDITGYCTCEDGWNGSNCEFTNECQSGANNCHKNASCQDTKDSYNCSCNIGFYGDGINCTECSDTTFGDQCSETCSCNAVGSIDCDDITGNCTCKDGWNGSNCELINECDSGANNCHKNASCQDMIDSYNCSCNIGFYGDGVNCTECNSTTFGDQCSETCSCNAVGSINCDDITGNCTCKDGWNGSNCDFTIECEAGANNCHKNASCQDTKDSYNCSCNVGFYGDGINCTECNSTTFGDQCSEKCSCNVVGSIDCDDLTGNCTCKDGWNGSNCEFTNECQSGANNCHKNASCQDTKDSYNCSCNVGFYGDGIHCTECSDTTFGDQCSETCSCNVVGSIDCDDITGNCTCKDGWNGSNCEFTNECESGANNCHKNASCQDTKDSFNCSCNVGFHGDGINCTECSDTAFGDQCSETCSCNVVGSIDCDDITGNCTCKDGWNGSNCEFTNECETGANNCHKNASCQDTKDSFNCSCNVGFHGDGINCTECSVTTFGDQCSETCSCNVVGSIDCDDITGNCTCKDGWNGSNCEFTNECESGANNCHKNASCQDTKDSFNCSCNVGFHGDGINCTECSDNTFGDQCSETCSCNMIGSVDCNDVTGYCTCKDGWNGTNCQFTDECNTDANNCHMNATCQDTIDSYNCSCDVGFYGNGINCTACGPKAYGMQCSKQCPCIAENTNDCNDITGACVCKDSWNGTNCDVHVDDCLNGTAVCDLTTQHCVLKIGTDSYFCSCRYGLNATSGICLSPTPPYITNSREEVKFKAETTLMVDVTQQEFEEKTTNITDNVFQMLEDHFKRTMRGFKSLIILSLSLGSLNVEYEIVVYKNTSSEEQTSEYVKASKELLSKSVIIESLGKNASVSSVKMSNENGKDFVLNTSSSQCAVLQHLYPCSDGQDCVETSGVAMCLGRKKENENLSLILGLGIGIPFLLAALAIMAIVYVYCQRRSQRRNESKQCDLNRSSIPIRYGSWGPKSMFSPWIHETEERKVPHLSEHSRDNMSIPPEVSKFTIRRPIADMNPNPVFRD